MIYSYRREYFVLKSKPLLVQERSVDDDNVYGNTCPSGIEINSEKMYVSNGRINWAAK